MDTIRLLYQKYKKSFLLDIVFCAIVILLLVLGFMLFLLSHFVVGRTELGSSLSLITLRVAQAPPLPFTDSIVTLQQNVVQWLDRPKSILMFTDPGTTYNNPTVQQLWLIVLGITDGVISIFFVISGYQVLFAGFTERYHESLEDLPNLIFAAIGANMSLLFARFWIDINNSVCSIVTMHAQSQPIAGLGRMNGGLSLITLPFLLVLILLLILLGIQLSGRLGIIILLTVSLAALFALLTKSRTQRLGQAGLMAYVTAVLLQCLQLSCITLGEKVLLPFLVVNSGLADSIVPIVTLLASIALLWITLRLPAMLRQWALAPIAESGRAARSFLLITGARLFSL